MLAYTLFTLFVISCAVLVVVILLQPGKADAGALFTSSVSSTAFGPRGTQNILAKVTIGAAIAFMLLALTLSLPGINGSRSVLQSGTVPLASPTPTPSPAPATAASPAPATTTSSVTTEPATKPAATPAVKASPKQ